MSSSAKYGSEMVLFIYLFIYFIHFYLQDSPTGAGINPQSTAPITEKRPWEILYNCFNISMRQAPALRSSRGF